MMGKTVLTMLESNGAMNAPKATLHSTHHFHGSPARREMSAKRRETTGSVMNLWVEGKDAIDACQFQVETGTDNEGGV
jgi:hypothetical protein